MWPEKEATTELAPGGVWKFILPNMWPTALWTEKMYSCDKNLQPLCWELMYKPEHQ